MKVLDISSRKNIVQHLANGTFGDNFCIICLNQLGTNFQHVFTPISKEENEMCIADILAMFCQLKFSDVDDYSLCEECFKNVKSAFCLYIQTKNSQALLQFYTDQLLTNTANIVSTSAKSMCLTISLYDVKSLKHTGITETNLLKQVKKDENDEVILIVRNGETLYFREENNKLVQLNESEVKVYRMMLEKTVKIEKPVRKRNRGPMCYKSCSMCPVKYRFLAKLKDHMKEAHNIDFYICKICKATTVDKQEHHDHLRTHTNVHQCAICGTVFKRRSTIIAHLKSHDKMKNIIKSEDARVCEVCGLVVGGELELEKHKEERHVKRHACYYCGKTYKGEASFARHLRKHELLGPVGDRMVKMEHKPAGPPQETSRPRCVCQTCGKDFVDQRALLWHQRLHNNERPYVCDTCGRGFVSLNRRNQHAICAHTAPSKRCPLCPALFHLCSMVNTHIKKVHLKTHKRRHRTVKQRNVFWRTESVPIKQLNVAIQNDVLEMQARSIAENNWGEASFIKTEIGL